MYMPHCGNDETGYNPLLDKYEINKWTGTKVTKSRILWHHTVILLAIDVLYGTIDGYQVRWHDNTNGVYVQQKSQSVYVNH